jgi:hypothetical protein
MGERFIAEGERKSMILLKRKSKALPDIKAC